MMKSSKTVLWAAFAVMALAAIATGVMASQQNAARVPMDSLKTLYFKDGYMTSSRRRKQLRQLQCVGNSRHICDTYGPDIAVCKNLGGGAWKCEADLHHSVRFGTVDVSCEGWNGPEDEYVLRGSCLLKYTLLPNYPERGYGKIPPQGSNKDIFVVLAIVVFVFFFFFYKRRSGEGQARGGGSGFWGGFGGGGDGGYPPSGPPPPYQPYPKPEPGTSTGANTQSAWRPGFWSGLASGALGAEAARRLREANQPDYAATARRRTFFDSDVDSFGFGGGGSNAFGPAGSSRSSGRESGETRTAYGYGGSSVR